MNFRNVPVTGRPMATNSEVRAPTVGQHCWGCIGTPLWKNFENQNAL